MDDVGAQPGDDERRADPGEKRNVARFVRHETKTDADAERQGSGCMAARKGKPGGGDGDRQAAPEERARGTDSAPYGSGGVEGRATRN